MNDQLYDEDMVYCKFINFPRHEGYFNPDL